MFSWYIFWTCKLSRPLLFKNRVLPPTLCCARDGRPRHHVSQSRDVWGLPLVCLTSSTTGKTTKKSGYCLNREESSRITFFSFFPFLGSERVTTLLSPEREKKDHRYEIYDGGRNDQRQPVQYQTRPPKKKKKEKIRLKIYRSRSTDPEPLNYKKPTKTWD